MLVCIDENMSLVGLSAQHSQLAFIPLMERRTPVRRTSEVFQFYRGVSPNVRVKKCGVRP